MTWLIGNLFWLVVIAGLALLAVFVLNRDTAGSIVTVASASTGRFGRWLRSQFPAWILQHEINKAGKDVNNFWAIIEEGQAHANGLQRKSNDKKLELIRLGKLAEQAVKQGDDSAAKQFILDKKRVETELASLEETLQAKREEISSAEANISSYETKITRIKSEAQEKAISLETKKADAAISKKLSDLNSSIDTGGLAAATAAMDEAIDRASAAQGIAKKRNSTVNKADEYEKLAMNEDADAELAALKASVAAKKSNSVS